LENRLTNVGALWWFEVNVNPEMRIDGECTRDAENRRRI
jgi:hypothetical protein